ncbi:MAG: hypothetical protein EOP38_02525, partial [Rubrivivax sp.]
MASQQPASEDLLGFTAEALEYMAGWTKAIEAKAAQHWQSTPLVRAAESLRLEGRRVPIGGGSAFTATDVHSFAADEPSALAEDDLSDLSLPLVDLGGESEQGQSPEPEEPVTQPSAFAESHLPSMDGELLTLELPPEDEPDLPAQVSEPDALEALPLEALPESAPESEPEPDLVLDLLSDEQLHSTASAELADAPQEPVFLESEPGALSVDEAMLMDALPVESEPVAASAEAEAPAETEPGPEPEPVAELDEQVKVIGPLRISIPLFNIYLNEADEQSRRLCTALSEWALELHHPVSDEAIALAHSLAGNSATVGYTELSQLARLLEHSLMRAQSLGRGEPEAAALFNEAADDIRHLLHQFAAGFLKTPKDDLMHRLELYDHTASRRIEARSLVAELDEAQVGGDTQSGTEEARAHGHLRLVHSADESGLPEPSFEDSQHHRDE